MTAGTAMFSLFHDSDVTCAYIGPNNIQYAQLRDMLCSNDIEVQPQTTFAAYENLSPTEVAKTDFLFVDIDGLGGVVKAYDALSQLRLAHPSVPVIMLSAEFHSDNFETTRRALGDVSLRSPILYASLELALFEARRNNADWRRNVVHYRDSVVQKRSRLPKPLPKKIIGPDLGSRTVAP